jgi:hypothetical protein
MTATEGFRRNSQGFKGNSQGFRRNSQGFRRNSQGFRRNSQTQISGIWLARNSHRMYTDQLKCLNFETELRK